MLLALAAVAVASATFVSAQTLPPGWQVGDTICEPADRRIRSDIVGGAYVCYLQPAEESVFGSRSAPAEDVTVCEGNPETQNSIRLTHLNTTTPSGEAEADCALALKFDLRRELPPNATARQATLKLWLDTAWYETDATRQPAVSRNLALRNVMGPWKEETARWETFPDENVNGSTNNEPPMSASGNEPYQGSQFLGGQQNFTFDVTPTVEGALRNYRTHLNGWLVRQEDSTCTQTTPCTHTFHSSAARDLENKPKVCGFGIPRIGNTYAQRPYCWPSLFVVLDPNRAYADNLTLHYNTSSQRTRYVYEAGTPATPATAFWLSGKAAMNLSIDGVDEIGRVKGATWRIENESERRVMAVGTFEKHVYNRSFDPRRDPGDRSLLWKVAPLNLPNGRYYLNVTVEDSDGWKTYTNMTAPLVWIENDPPQIAPVKVPTEIVQGSAANLTLNFTDPRGVEAAHVEVTTPTGRKETYKMWAVRRGEDATKTHFAVMWSTVTWFEPGLHKARVRVNDTIGNVNETTFEFRVLDGRAPDPCGLTVVAPLQRFGAWVQEEGAPVGVDACVTDVTSLNVTVRDARPDGTVAEHPLEAGEGGARWRANFTAEQPGRHDVTVVARDVDGNRAELGRFALVVEAAAPPAPDGVAPARGGWANATPTIAVTFRDLNLDRASLRLEVALGDGAFQTVTPFVQGTATEASMYLRGSTFDDGQLVRVRAAAKDALGRAAAPLEWSFTVDARAPRLNASIVGDEAPGPIAPYVTRAARLNATATDASSGVERVEVRWTNVDAKIETPWTALTGETAIVAAQVDRGAGLYEVRVRAVDRVGNAGVPEEVRFVLDPEPPAASVEVATGALLVDVRDAGSGIASLVVGARLQGDPSFRVHDLADEARRAPQGGLFRVETPVVARGETLEYYVAAVDALGNRRALGSPLDPVLHVGRNHAPVLDLDAPENGTEIEGPLDVSWTATDPDGDGVRVTARIRPVVLAEWEDLAVRAHATGVASWDSRLAPDGVYVLEVSARDLESSTEVRRHLVVNNTGTGIGRLVGPESRVEYLGDVRYEVTLYRPVVEATLKVYERDGRDLRHVATHDLRDDGTRGDRKAGDGVYTVVYPAGDKGRYVTDLEVVYADAGTVLLEGASAYAVKSSFTKVLERNFLWFLLGGAAVVALAAVVVVQLMRYGYI